MTEATNVESPNDQGSVSSHCYRVFFAKLRPFHQLAFNDDYQQLAMLDYESSDDLLRQQIELMQFWRQNQGKWSKFHQDANGYTYASDVDDVVLVHPTWLEDATPIADESTAELVAAAKDIRDNPGADCHGTVGFCAIENPKLERLAVALDSVLPTASR